MTQQMTTWLFLLSVSLAAGAEQHPELHAFPAAAAGQQRLVIVLPARERGEEDDFQVELIIGKEMETDGVNLVRLAAVLEPRNLQGWGYTYYEAAGSGELISTLMAPPAGSKPVHRFVGGTPLFIRYNSRLPIVIYAPEGYQVRYRIWQAPTETSMAEAG